MVLSKSEAEKLFSMGFKRPEYTDEVYPQDIYEYQNSTWVVGGRILPSGDLLCNDKVYKDGIWLPSQEDLYTWLEENECKYTLTYNGIGYKVEATVENGKKFQKKGATIEFVLCNVIMQILEEYGGNPVKMTYDIIEAELIEKKDL